MLEIINCTTPLNYPKDFNSTGAARFSHMAFRRMTGPLVLDRGAFSLLSSWNSVVPEIRVLIDNVDSVTIEASAFSEVIVNVVIQGAKVLTVRDQSFASCWGTVWIFNSVDDGVAINAATSSDLVMWRKVGTEEDFKAHVRPKTTPLQKFQGAMDLALRLDRLGEYHSAIKKNPSASN